MATNFSEAVLLMGRLSGLLPVLESEIATFISQYDAFQKEQAKIVTLKEDITKASNSAMRSAEANKILLSQIEEQKKIMDKKTANLNDLISRMETMKADIAKQSEQLSIEKEAQSSVATNIKSLNKELNEREQDLKVREATIEKERAIDRERRLLLDAKERQIKIERDRLQALATDLHIS